MPRHSRRWFSFVFSVFAIFSRFLQMKMKVLTAKYTHSPESNPQIQSKMACVYRKSSTKCWSSSHREKTPPTRPSAHNSALKLHLFIFGHLLWQFKMFARADVLYPPIFSFWYICIYVYVQSATWISGRLASQRFSRLITWLQTTPPDIPQL